MKWKLQNALSSLLLSCFAYMVKIHDNTYDSRGFGGENVRIVQNSMTNDPNMRWPTGPIRYSVNPEIDSNQRQLISNAMGMIEKHTCLRFWEVHDYSKKTPLLHKTILFEPTINLFKAYVPLGSPQDQNACTIGLVRYRIEVKDIIFHIFRLLGRGHEHARPDRDQYIAIKWENIIPGCPERFNSKVSLVTQSLPYDYRSIMHFVSKAFSKNGQPTIVPINQSIPLKLLGSSELPTELDYMHINLLYCQATTIMIRNVEIVQGSTYIDLRWSAPKFVPDYYKGKAVCTISDNHKIEKAYATSQRLNMTIKNLIPGSICKIHFRAVYNPATYDSGLKQVITLKSEVPAASPPNLHVVRVNKHSATVKWGPLDSNQTYGAITSYLLGIKEHDPFKEYSEIVVSSKGKRKHKFIDLLPCTKYHVKVAAVNLAGVGKYSYPQSFVTKGVCSQPVHITSIEAHREDIVVKWKPMTDERKRGLYIELQYAEEGEVDWIIKLQPPGINQYTIKDLFPSTYVFIRLRTVSECGVFGPVTKRTVKTKKLPPRLI